MTIKRKKVIIGGTFDMLHDGHKALLKRASDLGEMTLGLTSDIMAKETKKREVEDFKYRKKELEDFAAKNLKAEFKIVKIEDKFGPTLKEDFDYIVVSPATHPTAELINERRQEIAKKSIEINTIEFVLAEDGEPISSTKIANEEIDRQGRLLKE